MDLPSVPPRLRCRDSSSAYESYRHEHTEDAGKSCPGILRPSVEVSDARSARWSRWQTPLEAKPHRTAMMVKLS
jgi:hypothetical protein